MKALTTKREIFCNYLNLNDFLTAFIHCLGLKGLAVRNDVGLEMEGLLVVSSLRLYQVDHEQRTGCGHIPSCIFITPNRVIRCNFSLSRCAVEELRKLVT